MEKQRNGLKKVNIQKHLKNVKEISKAEPIITQST
jgi:hypothetical protein